MINFYMLVIAFSMGRCENRFSLSKAEPPFVAFYWNKSKLLKDMNAMPSRVDTVKAFRVECDYDGCSAFELGFAPEPKVVVTSTHAFDRGK